MKKTNILIRFARYSGDKPLLKPLAFIGLALGYLWSAAAQLFAEDRFIFKRSQWKRVGAFACAFILMFTFILPNGTYSANTLNFEQEDAPAEAGEVLPEENTEQAFVPAPAPVEESFLADATFQDTLKTYCLLCGEEAKEGGYTGIKEMGQSGLVPGMEKCGLCPAAIIDSARGCEACINEEEGRQEEPVVCNDCIEKLIKQAQEKAEAELEKTEAEQEESLPAGPATLCEACGLELSDGSCSACPQEEIKDINSGIPEDGLSIIDCEACGEPIINTECGCGVFAADMPAPMADISQTAAVPENALTISAAKNDGVAIAENSKVELGQPINYTFNLSFQDLPQENRTIEITVPKEFKYSTHYQGENVTSVSKTTDVYGNHIIKYTISSSLVSVGIPVTFIPLYQIKDGDIFSVSCKFTAGEGKSAVSLTKTFGLEAVNWTINPGQYSANVAGEMKNISLLAGASYADFIDIAPYVSNFFYKSGFESAPVYPLTDLKLKMPLPDGLTPMSGTASANLQPLELNKKYSGINAYSRACDYTYMYDSEGQYYYMLFEFKDDTSKLFYYQSGGYGYSIPLYLPKLSYRADIAAMGGASSTSNTVYAKAPVEYSMMNGDKQIVVKSSTTSNGYRCTLKNFEISDYYSVYINLSSTDLTAKNGPDPKGYFSFYPSNTTNTLSEPYTLKDLVFTTDFSAAIQKNVRCYELDFSEMPYSSLGDVKVRYYFSANENDYGEKILTGASPDKIITPPAGKSFYSVEMTVAKLPPSYGYYSTFIPKYKFELIDKNFVVASDSASVTTTMKPSALIDKDNNIIEGSGFAVKTTYATFTTGNKRGEIYTNFTVGKYSGLYLESEGSLIDISLKAASSYYNGAYSFAAGDKPVYCLLMPKGYKYVKMESAGVENQHYVISVYDYVYGGQPCDMYVIEYIVQNPAYNSPVMYFMPTEGVDLFNVEKIPVAFYANANSSYYEYTNAFENISINGKTVPMVKAVANYYGSNQVTPTFTISPVFDYKASISSSNGSSGNGASISFADKATYVFSLKNFTDRAEIIPQFSAVVPLPQQKGEAGRFGLVLDGPVSTAGAFFEGCAILYSSDGSAYGPYNEAAKSSYTHIKVTSAQSTLSSKTQASFYVPLRASLAAANVIGDTAAIYTSISVGGAEQGIKGSMSLKAGGKSFIGSVFYDDNNDGMYTSGEPGTGGSLVIEKDGQTVATLSSMPYSHTVISPGTYSLEYTKKADELFGKNMEGFVINGNTATKTISLGYETVDSDLRNSITVLRQRTLSGTSSIKVVQGTPVQLNPAASPALGTGQKFSYSSSNSSVVTVSEAGLVSFAGEGSAVITITAPKISEDFAATPSMTVSVKSELAGCQYKEIENSHTLSAAAGGSHLAPGDIILEAVASPEYKLYYSGKYQISGYCNDGSHSNNTMQMSFKTASSIMPFGGFYTYGTGSASQYDYSQPLEIKAGTGNYYQLTRPGSLKVDFNITGHGGTVNNSSYSYNVKQKFNISFALPNKLVYDGSAKSVSLSAIPSSVPAAAYTVMYSKRDADTWSSSAPVDAGQYKAKIVLNESLVPGYGLKYSELYIIGTGNNIEFEILPANVEFTVNQNSLTYNGGAQKALVAPVGNLLKAADYSVAYKPEGVSAPSASEVSNAGVYDIYITLTNPNIKFAGESINIRELKLGTKLNIAKAPLTFSVSDNEPVYDKNRHTANVSPGSSLLSTADYSVSYLPANETGDGAASVTNAGAYDIYISLTNGNFRFADESSLVGARQKHEKQLVIKQADVSFEVDENSYVYDKNAKEATVGQKSGELSLPVGGFTVAYKPKDAGGLGFTKVTDAGSYNIYVKLNNNNYRFAGKDGSVREIMLSETLEISRAAVSFDVEGNSLTYTGEKLNALVTQRGGGLALPEGGFTVSYMPNGSEEGDASAFVKAAGSYDIYIRLENDNYCFEDCDSDVREIKHGSLLIIDKAEQHLSAVDKYIVQGDDMGFNASVLKGESDIEESENPLFVYSIRGEGAGLAINPDMPEYVNIAGRSDGVVRITSVETANYKQAYIDVPVIIVWKPSISIVTTRLGTDFADISLNIEKGTFALADLTGWEFVLADTENGGGGVVALPAPGKTNNAYTLSSLAPAGKYRLSVSAVYTNPATGQQERITSQCAIVTLKEEIIEGATVRGVVFDEKGEDGGISVSLQKGGVVVGGAAGLGSGGAFEIANVADGYYNLVVSSGTGSVTKMIQVKNGIVYDSAGIPQDNISITIEWSKSSVIEADAHVPPVSVDGVEKIFENDKLFTEADKKIVNEESGSIKIFVKVKAGDQENLDADQTIIVENKAPQEEIGAFFDISIVKTIYDGAGRLIEQASLKDLNGTLVRFVLDIPDELLGMDYYRVVAVHDGEHESLETEFDPETNTLSFWASRFSTYAIVYIPKPEPTPEAQPVKKVKKKAAAVETVEAPREILEETPAPAEEEPLKESPAAEGAKAAEAMEGVASPVEPEQKSGGPVKKILFISLGVLGAALIFFIIIILVKRKKDEEEEEESIEAGGGKTN